MSRLYRLFVCFALFGVTSVIAQDAAPLRYEAALQGALAGPRVTLAENKLELAQKQLEVASSFVSADLSAGYSVTRGALNAPELDEPRSLDSSGFDPITLNASFNVFSLGPQADQISRARLEVARARNNLRDERAAVLIETTERYLNALRASGEEALAQLKVAYATQVLEATRSRLAVGAANEADVLQADIALSRAENERAEATRETLQQLAALSLLIGEDVVAVADAPPSGSLGELELDAATLATLLAQRSDVQAARLAVQEAEISYHATLRENLPSGSLQMNYAHTTTNSTFGLGAGFDTRSFQPSLSASLDPDSGNLPGSAPLEGASSSSFTVSVGLTVPLDTALPAALAAGQLALEQSRVNATQTLELAKLELANTRRALDAAKAALLLAEQLMEQSEQAAEAARERLALGLVSVLAVQGAENDAAEAALNFSRTQDAVLLAQMRLAAALALDPLEVF